MTTDHGSLSGLLDDDHPQYLLVNGTRAMSGALNMGAQNIFNAGTLNGVDITNLSPRLIPGGADALPTGTPVSVGNSNNMGSATDFARSDHIHAHGPLAVTFNGVIRNWSPAVKFAGWGEGVGPAGNPACLYLPYASTLHAFTVFYISATAATIPVGDSVTFTVGTIAAGLAPIPANYVPLLGTDIVFDNSDTGTYPRKAVTGLSLALPVLTSLSVRAVPTAGVLPTNADIVVTVWLDAATP